MNGNISYLKSAGTIRLSLRARILTFAAYLSVIIIVMCFHEPWFDEAQSWLIARDSSFADLLTLRPHYEGHPPLWTLLLSIPAKTGVPYEIGLKGVQLLCAALLGGWLIFRAPFSRLAIILLPFTYFFCFQYGVTSRPYALLCATLLMAAHYWKQADSKPSCTWKLMLSLALMCVLSAYGIALAAGFALAWVFRVIKSAGLSHAFSAIFSNIQRLLAWVLLAFVGVASVACIWPASNAFGSRATFSGNSQIVQFLYFLFVVPSESAFTAFGGDVSLRRLTLGVLPTAICVIVSLLMWACLLRIAHRRSMTADLIFPYLAFSAVATQYFTLHHSGIVFVLFLAQLWMCIAKRPLDRGDVPAMLVKLFAQLRPYFAKYNIVNQQKAVNLLIVLLLAPSLVWNAFACVNDIRFDYSGSRALAQFIKRNHAENKRFVTSWLHKDEQTDKYGNVISPEVSDIHQYSWQLITANPYFAKNLIDCSYKNSSFITNEQPSEQQSYAELAACRSKREPQFFVTESSEPWYYFLSLDYNIEHYTPHVIAQTKSSWKARTSDGKVTVYERKSNVKTK